MSCHFQKSQMIKIILPGKKEFPLQNSPPPPQPPPPPPPLKRDFPYFLMLFEKTLTDHFRQSTIYETNHCRRRQAK